MSKATKPLWQRFVLFLVPMMVSNILQAMSGTVNSIYVGQLLGVDALASISVFIPILIFLISFVVGLSSGATILIGQAWGAKNIDKVKEVTGTTLTAGFLGGIVVAVIGLLFSRDVMQLLGAPANILEDAAAYGRLVLIGMPGFFVFLIITSMLRGVGDTLTPLVSLIVSIAVGLIVTPALIMGWWGLPRIGVLSAAAAFIAGFMVVLVFLFFYLNWRKSPMAFDAEMIRHLHVNWPVFKLVLKLGIPAGVQMIVASLSVIVVVGIVNRFGSDATAAYGAVNQVLGYIQFPALSIAITSSILAAQAIGARRMDDVEHVTRTGLIMNIVITGSFVLIAYLFSQNLVSLFITDPAVIEVTETLLHIVLWAVILYGLGSVFSAVMRASGDVLIPMLLSLGTIACVEIPGALLLSQSMGLNGIWIAYCMSFATLLILQAGYYVLVWRKKEIRALV